MPSTALSPPATSSSTGAPLAYACTRPPGHHVTRTAYGGSCYLNNAAVSAQYLRDRGATRVAIVDVDVHHGNGAQSIFWERGDVITCSVHVDPAAGWFPHYIGLAGERGGGAGEGANLNLTLPPGTADDGWLEAIGAATEAVREHGADMLVVALGVDAATNDPNSPLEVTADGFATGRRAPGRARAADGGRAGGWLRSRDDRRARARHARGHGDRERRVRTESLWVGKEELGGVPTQERRGSPLPPHWRLEAVWATERPRTPSISADGRLVAFIQDRDTSDIRLLQLETARCRG